MSNGLNISLKSYDSIFQNDEQRNSEEIKPVPISELKPFEQQPFKVLLDESMDELVDSIKQSGVLTPVIARPHKDGGYEILSGHRRVKACELAGITDIPVVVKNLDDDTATILLVDSNLQREHILPSEKAFAYQMKLEAMNRKAGRPSNENRSQIGNNSEHKRSAEIFSEEVGESKNTIFRYIRLTELIPELLQLVDESRIAFRPAVELSYLKKEEQASLLEEISYTDATPSLAQAIKMRKFSNEGKLSHEVIESIMSEEKPNQKEKINIKYEDARKFIPASVPYDKTGDYIMKALEYYHRYQERQKDRDAR